MADDLLDRWHASASGDRAFVGDVHGEHKTSAIDRHAAAIAHHLLAGRASLVGDRIAILAAPGARFVAALIGIWRAHGTAVVLLPEHPEGEQRYALADSGARTLLFTREHAARITELGDAISARPIEEISPLARAPASKPAPPDAPALMLYTSGTTSKPKGAVLSRENIRVQAALLETAWGTTADDVLVHALPLHHMHGLAIALVNVLFAGASARMLKWNAHDVWRAMDGATMFMAVPTMYAKLFAALDESPAELRAQYSEFASRLRLATSGSAALPVTLGERFRAIAGQFPLERFGMTEIGVGLTNPLHGERRPGHVGFPLASVDTRIVGDDGNDALEGELWVRGPSVFLRYHEREDATRAAFVADPHGGAHWFKTGDTVTRDGEKGPFKILGRTSQDILKSGGYKLSALEIEEVFREHPAVSEVAVIGLSDETWGERVIACVVAKPGASATEEELRAFAKEKLAFYKVPKRVLLRDDLPKNALGKIQKSILKSALASEDT